MFDIIKKRSEIVLDCFTYDYNAYNCFKIDQAQKFIPKWWKDLPSDVTIENQFVSEIPAPTMKGCTGFIDFYKNGFIIPLWTDIIINTTESNYSYQCADNKSTILNHDATQYNNTFNFLLHLKLILVWTIKCKEAIDFMWTSPFWSNSDDENVFNNLFIVPGVLNFKYQTTANVNMFIPKKPNRIFLEAGKPLVHLFPKTEKNITLRHHHVSIVEFEKTRSNSFAFKLGELKRKKFMQPQTCPFK